MKRWIFVTTAGAAVLAMTGCQVDRGAQDQAKRTEEMVMDQTPVVDVQAVRTETVTEELEITGDIVTGADVAIGAKQPGRISSVYVKEGQAVKGGQLIATLDTSQLYAQLRQAQSQVSSASAAMSSATAQLAQARRNASAGPAKSSSAVRSAEAQLRSAKAQLQKAQAGARPQEIRQAETNVASTRSNLTTQEKELERIEVLVREGALPGNRLDQQRNLVNTARAQYESAVQALDLAREGARPEDVSSAEEAVRQAQEAVAAAKVQKDLDPLLQDQVRAAEAQVEAARSQVEGARAGVAVIQQSIEDMQIRAPFAGKIVGQPAQPGTIAGAGTNIARLVGGAGAYFSGQVPASDIDKVTQGMPVEIRIDGLDGKMFIGSVASVAPLGESVGRLFSVVVTLGGPSSEVRPGMFARGTVRLRTIQNATMVPSNAVVTRGETKVVYLLDGDTAREAKVTTGVQRDSWVQVTGVPIESKIVVDGQTKLRDGVKVKVKPATTAADASGEDSGS